MPAPDGKMRKTDLANREEGAECVWPFEIHAFLMKRNDFELPLENLTFPMPVSPLSKGKKVPTFSVTDQEGNSFSLKDYEGKKVILFFYPRDNTPTCTEEACNLRDNYRLLQEQGFEVIGVSNDSAQKHQNFIKKFTLPFRLIADTDNKLTEAFGVWGEKQLFGRHYMGLVRTTFVIDEKGKVAYVISKVEAKNHAAQLLEVVGN